MKNRALISCLILCLVSHFSFAKTKYFPKFKKQEYFSISYDLGITQKAMLSKTSINQQKFLDLMHRFGASKSINKNVSIYGTISFTGDHYKLFQSQQFSSENYNDYKKDILFSVGTQYNVGLWNFMSIHPRLGFSYLRYNEPIQMESGQVNYRSNSTTFVNLGLQGRIHLTKTVALTGTMEYLQHVDPFTNSNQFKNLNTMSVSAGVTVNLRNLGLLDPCRRCPVF